MLLPPINAAKARQMMARLSCDGPHREEFAADDGTCCERADV